MMYPLLLSRTTEATESGSSEILIGLMNREMQPVTKEQPKVSSGGGKAAYSPRLNEAADTQSLHRKHTTS